MEYTIADITLPDALRLCIEGQRAWPFELNRLDKAKRKRADFVIGETVYITDSHKCPNPKDLGRRKQKDKATKLCLPYLREEVRLIQPKAIVAFAEDARRSVEKACGVKWSGSVKRMPDHKRVLTAEGRLYAVLSHPDGIWRNPPMSREESEAAIAFIFAAAKQCVAKELSPGGPRRENPCPCRCQCPRS